METILAWIEYGIGGVLILTTIFTVAVWWATLRFRKHISESIIRWDKPIFGLWTSILFLFVLLFTSLGMLAYAFSSRLFSEPSQAPLWREIASLCFLEVSMLILLFAGLRGHYLYILSERGIYDAKFDWKRLAWNIELIPWEEIYDYYHHDEGALVRYTLLLRSKRQIFLEVPLHLKDAIEKIILLGTEKFSFLQKYSHMTRRHHSES
ncbi:MAG: hypothetical protein NZ989_03050 [Bacteroidia bacterium]|nr:hypothetical protein [Bacteroidia bacterium]MDW8056911.1 hypothetical protein [Bacteroidia bacterium]